MATKKKTPSKKAKVPAKKDAATKKMADIVTVRICRFFIKNDPASIVYVKSGDVSPLNLSPGL